MDASLGVSLPFGEEFVSIRRPVSAAALAQRLRQDDHGRAGGGFTVGTKDATADGHFLRLVRGRRGGLCQPGGLWLLGGGRRAGGKRRGAQYGEAHDEEGGRDRLQLGG